MPYNITSYTKNKAKQLNVIIKPSTNPSKKLDVYKNNKKIASVGAIGYNDYPTFIIKQGKQFADKRKKSRGGNGNPTPRFPRCSRGHPNGQSI